MRVTRRAQRRGRPRRRPGTHATYVERVNLAIDSILEHLDEPLRLHQLAEVAGMSPFHFHRVFQAIVGETPADFSRRMRLEKALTLMAQVKHRSLTAIAFKCGFGSSSDFSRSFKRHYGVSPRSFDLGRWSAARAGDLRRRARISRLPPRGSSGQLNVRLRELPARRVAYIRVRRPYESRRVVDAAARLVAWASGRGLAGGEWLGYQWENPEITRLADCLYHVAVVVAPGGDPGVGARGGEIGRHSFPPLLVAEVPVDGGVVEELHALEWLYGVWLPRSRYEPADFPCFEAWAGLPFADGTDRFRLLLQLPVKRR